MLTHHTLECAKSGLNPENHCLVNDSFLLTVFAKSISLVWQVCNAPLWNLLSGAPHTYFGAPCTPVEEGYFRSWVPNLSL